MNHLAMNRQWAALGIDATPQPVTTPAELYERLQEQLEADAARQERRTKEARAIRRYVGEQPRRLVVLDAVMQPPGQPSWEFGETGPLATGIPDAWAVKHATRLLARRA